MMIRVFTRLLTVFSLVLLEGASLQGAELAGAAASHHLAKDKDRHWRVVGRDRCTG